MQSRSWGYCTMLSPRMQPSAWVLKSRLGQLADARAHRAVSTRARGLHPGQSAPWAARWRSCSSSRQRTSAGVAPRASRALGSSLALVLIKRPAHVRGGCTPGKSRPGQLATARAHRTVIARPRGLHPGQVAPWAARWRSCSSRGQRTCAAGAGCPLRHAKGMTLSPAGSVKR